MLIIQKFIGISTWVISFTHIYLSTLLFLVHSCLICLRQDKILKIINMLKSMSPQIPPREPRVIRLTVDQEAVLQEQFNRWPKIPMHADIVLLAAETGLSEEDVHDWYTLRLSRLRKEQGLGGNFGLNN